ncbi:hypothetical protein [Pseudalkalibacillus hwajinpoensis]|uniref:hypothetical protein n=1 Tax=Guptibacillus hwajinpoensis TaxID=208199 RepID=UPI00146B2064|nr:hypothetical protein [Pseudalkalibacillus hwajinpoensis]
MAQKAKGATIASLIALVLVVIINLILEDPLIINISSAVIVFLIIAFGNRFKNKEKKEH